MAVSPDGKTLATGHMDGTVNLWDRQTGKRQAVLAGHKFRVWAVAFSPDGKKLVSVAGSWHRPSDPGEVKLWDLPAGKDGAHLPRPRRPRNARRRAEGRQAHRPRRPGRGRPPLRRRLAQAAAHAPRPQGQRAFGGVLARRSPPLYRQR